MASTAAPYMSEEAYLRHDRMSDVKSEYHDGLLFPICAVSWEHAQICGALAESVRSRLRGGEYQPGAAPIRIRVRYSKYVCPDLVVVCGKAEFTDSHADTLTNPKAIVEVLSPSTAGYDRGGKFDLYQELPSFEEYVLVSQDEFRIEVRRRMPDGSWVLTRQEGPDAVLRIGTLGIAIPLSEIYAGIL